MEITAHQFLGYVVETPLINGAGSVSGLSGEEVLRNVRNLSAMFTESRNFGRTVSDVVYDYAHMDAPDIQACLVAG